MEEKAVKVEWKSVFAHEEVEEADIRELEEGDGNEEQTFARIGNILIHRRSTYNEGWAKRSCRGTTSVWETVCLIAEILGLIVVLFAGYMIFSVLFGGLVAFILTIMLFCIGIAGILVGTKE